MLHLAAQHAAAVGAASAHMVSHAALGQCVNTVSQGGPGRSTWRRGCLTYNTKGQNGSPAAQRQPQHKHTQASSRPAAQLQPQDKQAQPPHIKNNSRSTNKRSPLPHMEHVSKPRCGWSGKPAAACTTNQGAEVGDTTAGCWVVGRVGSVGSVGRVVGDATAGWAGWWETLQQGATICSSSY